MTHYTRKLGDKALPVIFAFSLCVQTPGQQHQHPPAAPAQAGTGDRQFAQLSIPDVVLVNQRGEKVHVYSELISGKVAVINSIFSTCTTICLPMGANFSRLQTLLGDLAGDGVNLISISADPVNDTPDMLRAWGATFHAGNGWTLLTGPKSDVDKLLRALRLYAADKQAHTPLAVIGAGRGWTTVSALSDPRKLAAMARAELAVCRGEKP